MRAPVLLLTLTLLLPGAQAAPEASPEVVRISAKRYSFTPDHITLKKGVSVVLELVSEDRKHGFEIAEWKVRATITPNKVTRLTVKPEKAGKFVFRCDIFCGSGHEDMNGEIVVEE